MQQQRTPVQQRATLRTQHLLAIHDNRLPIQVLPRSQGLHSGWAWAGTVSKSALRLFKFASQPFLVYAEFSVTLTADMM